MTNDEMAKEIIANLDKPTVFPEMTPREVVDEVKTALISELRFIKGVIRASNQLMVSITSRWDAHYDKHGMDENLWNRAAWIEARGITFNSAYEAGCQDILKTRKSCLQSMMKLITQNEKRWNKE